MKGTIHSIFISPRRGEAMSAQATAELVAACGLEGDSHAGDTEGRHLSLIAREDVPAALLEAPEGLGKLRVNLITSGLDLTAVGNGRRLRVGGAAVIQVVQVGFRSRKREGKSPCRRGEVELPRERGVYARVVGGGPIESGDPIATEAALNALRYAVITLSDRASRGETEDLSGPLIGELIEAELDAHRVAARVLPDEEDALCRQLIELCDGEVVDLILTTGGTGLSPRDHTPEATRRAIDREVPGMAEAIRAAGLEKTPFAMLSRAVVGLRRNTLIINLSGSPRAVREQLAVVLPVLPHALETAAGVKVSCARPEGVKSSIDG